MHPQIAHLISLQYDAQRSEEWLKLRGNMITASDAATVIGVNPYETVDDFILKKCGYKKFFGNDATAHGNKYEDEARDIWCKRTGEVCHEIGLYPHPEYDWLGGSPDGITESGKLVEIKCPLKRHITDEVPVHYMPQLQLLMHILDLKEAVFIQYKPSELTWPKPYEFSVVEVPREEDWLEKHLPTFRSVWDRVLHHRQYGIEPPPVTKKRERKPKPVKCLIVDDD